MITFRQIYLASLLTILSSNIVAVEPKFAFREIQIGDSLESVRRAMVGKFSHVKETTSFEQIVLVGSDRPMQTECLDLLLTESESTCDLGKFFFWPTESGDRLAMMSVDHRFSAPIPATEVIAKITEAFGAPRRTYHGDSVTWKTYDRRDDTVLLWGGRQAPARFRPSSEPEYLLIGGKYIVATVQQIRDNAVGYQLMIVDADQDLQSRYKSEKRREAKAFEQREKTRKSNVDSIQF